MSEPTPSTITPPPPQKTGMGGWVKALFILSLALNFLVLGAVLGGVIAHRRAPPVQLSDRSFDASTFGPLGGAFSHEDRLAMRAAAEGQGTDLAAIQGAMRADFTRLEAALRAEPFDPAAVRAVLAEMRARSDKRMDMGEALMLSRLETMTPKERARFAERLRRGVERFERRLQERRLGPPEGHGPDHD